MRLHFLDLFDVALIVPRDVKQPLVGVECIEHREGMLGGVSLQGLVHLLGERQRLRAQLVVLFQNFFARHLAFGPNLKWRSRLALPRRHDLFKELGLAFGLGFPLRIRGAGQRGLGLLEQQYLAAHDVFDTLANRPALWRGFESPLCGRQPFDGLQRLLLRFLEQGNQFLTFFAGQVGLRCVKERRCEKQCCECPHGLRCNIASYGRTS